ncbi:kinetochore protein SPC24 homolog [Lycium barbarum]|uniref:kinetochore protein SPC24 homolog n=1 Tax=Lycium barbarum TaxID=112863 RepID=UPI00293F3034|nr:kinetochore protein SPC24 homolog [Lycium barbarum]
MVDGSNIDVEKLKLFSKDLVGFLKDDKDACFFKQCLEQSNALQSHSHSQYQLLRDSIQDYQEKINACKQRTTEAQSEAAADAEIDKLQKELEQEIQREQLLREELRVITDEVNDLDHQRASIEEQRQLLKKLEQDQLRAEMKLSLYASVTSIIPDLDDQSKISGQIVERDKKVVENFEFDSSKLTTFDTCNSIWKMINS